MSIWIVTYADQSIKNVKAATREAAEWAAEILNPWTYPVIVEKGEK